MPVKPIYKDFFHFLAHRSDGDPWEIYQQLYLNPHAGFFTDYWRHFHHFDPSQIAQRARQIQKGDYGQLQSLIVDQHPDSLAEGALERCRAIVPLSPEPWIYLAVGFFSPDGMTVRIDGRPAIVIGLERFKTLQDLPLLIAHEYGHCAHRSLHEEGKGTAEGTLIQMVQSEGLAVLFSEAAYPEIPLYRHLFLTPERFQWCRENREALLELAEANPASSKLVPVFFGPGDPAAGLPPRLGYFIAREMVLHSLGHPGANDWQATFPGFSNIFARILGRSPEPRVSRPVSLGRSGSLP